MQSALVLLLVAVSHGASVQPPFAELNVRLAEDLPAVSCYQVIEQLQVHFSYVANVVACYSIYKVILVLFTHSFYVCTYTEMFE